MNTMMASTKVKFPKAPTELPMIFISMFRVGQDLASLKTLSYKKTNQTKKQNRQMTLNLISS